MPRVTIHAPSGPPVSYRLQGDAMTVGRSTVSDLVVHDPALSRLHAELRRGAYGWEIIDRASSNGTTVNGRPVSQPTRLASGDRIHIGDTTLVFDLGDGPASRADDDGSATRTIRLGADDDEIVGQSPAIVELLRRVDRVAASSSSVLITGENGTGKELVARRLHRRSGRTGPLVVVNCPALPGSLLESELFGVERGVATGVEARAGLFEAADGGTIMLDEVGDMPLGAQAALLRVLQERSVVRLGARRSIAVDVRVVAATNHDLEADVAAGRFRRDLFHRLEVVSLHVPPLRERAGDVPLLAAFALGRARGPSHTLAPETIAALSRHDFPGNVRELLHAIEQAAMFAEDGTILPEHLPPAIGRTPLNAKPDPLVALCHDLLDGRRSFWLAVRDPFLARELSRDDARRLVERLHAECGGSYKRLAERLDLAGGDYKRLLNFLRNHDLGVNRR